MGGDVRAEYPGRVWLGLWSQEHLMHEVDGCPGEQCTSARLVWICPLAQTPPAPLELKASHLPVELSDCNWGWVRRGERVQ